jgi:hypothetical protein
MLSEAGFSRVAGLGAGTEKTLGSAAVSVCAAGTAVSEVSSMI